MKQDEILNKIKKSIYDINPLAKPRVHTSNFFSTKAPEMGIQILFFDDENSKLKTQVIFSEGNYYHKNSVSSFVIDNLIEKEVILELLKFILKNFPIISDFETKNSEFSLEFTFPAEMNNLEGISCRKITLDFSSRNHKYIISEYLIYILNNFYKELINTTLFKTKYEEYLNQNKDNILSSLDEVGLRKIIGLLNEQELRNLLKNIPDEVLVNLYNQCYKDTENIPKKLIKKLEKEVLQV